MFSRDCRTNLVFALVGAALAGCSEYDFSTTDVTYADAPTDEPPPTYREDVNTQRERVAEADILFVIDNSCSMADDQERLTSAFPLFMNFFLGLTDVDYHIGVVNTDVERQPTLDVDGLNGGGDDGALRTVQGLRWIDRATSDPIPTFDTMARMGTAGSGNESGTMAAYKALGERAEAWNQGFLRPDALLSVIIVSDEDDSSPSKGLPAADFVAFMDDLKFEPDLLTVSAIVGPAPEGCETAVIGANYLEVQGQLGGISWDICDDRWDVVLQELAFLAAGLRREFFLTERPLVETLAVQVVNGADVQDFALDVDFSYDPVRNSIQFLDYLPDPLAKVRITYDVDPGGVHH